MGFTLSTDSYKAYADKNAKTFSGYSSLSENFAAGVGQVIDEELSISSWLHDEGISARNQKIRNMVSDGKIEQELVDMYTTGNPGRGKKVDYNSIVEYLNWTNSLDEKIPTDKELTDERNEELATKRKYRNEVFNTSLTGGKVAAFVGGFVASGLDPVNVATMTLAAPVAGARAVSRSMYALKTARNSAALNVGVSVPIEPFIHSWKEEIGAEYTIEDSLFNIAAAGVLGGSVSGIGAAIGKGLGSDISPLISKIKESALEKKSYDNMVTEFKKAGADEDDAENLARFIDEANHAPDPNMNAEEFVRKTEESQSGMDAGNKSDVEPNFDSEDAVLKTQFDRPELAEGEVQTDTREHVPADNIMVMDDGTQISFREASAKLDGETEFLISKLDCLNG